MTPAYSTRPTIITKTYYVCLIITATFPCVHPMTLIPMTLIPMTYTSPIKPRYYPKKLSHQ